MSNAITLLASQVPAAMVPSATYKIEDTLAGGYAPHAEQFIIGENNASLLASYLNSYGMRLDLLSRHGGTANCICRGLGISAGSGLTLNVATGLAHIDAGFVELKSTDVLTITLSNNNPNYIWLKTDGTLYKDTTTAAPASQAVYLGYALTSGGAITQLDDAGRYVVTQGQVERTTADTGTPGDTPSSSLRFYAVTLGGLYYWDGSTWHRVNDLLSPNAFFISSGQSEVIPPNTIVSILSEDFTVEGTVTVRGTLLIRA